MAERGGGSVVKTDVVPNDDDDNDGQFKFPAPQHWNTGRKKKVPNPFDSSANNAARDLWVQIFPSV